MAPDPGTTPDDVERLARLGADLLEAVSEKDVYARLGEALLGVVGEAVVLVSRYDHASATYRPEALLGLGPFAEQLTAVFGKRPSQLSGDFSPIVREAIAVGQLVKVPGGVFELGRAAIPQPLLRAAAAIIGLDEVHVIGFRRGGAAGGVCILPRHAAPLRRAVIEGMTWFAASALARLRATAELRDSEERFRVAAAGTTDVIYEWHVDSGEFRWFGPIEGFLGCAPGEAPRSITAFSGLILAEDRERVLTTAYEGIRSSRRWQGEYRVHRKDGGVAHWFGTGLGVDAVAGRATRVIGAIADVTARRAAEEALHQREAQILALGDNLPQGLVYQIETGPSGATRRFAYISAGVERLHGVTQGQVLADPQAIYSQIVEEDRPRLAALEMEAIARLTPFNIETRVRLPSGEVRWRFFASAPRRRSDGELVWDGIELDVHERHQAEEARERLQAQLAQAQKMESVGRLAGGVAHDFNNMLGVILGNVDFALSHVEPESPLRADLEEIHSAAARSADLTRQLLAFARKQTIAPEELDLDAAVGGALAMIARLLGENIRLNWSPGEAGSVLIDPTQLQQILANLCVNARDAIDGAGHIDIRTSRRSVGGGGAGDPAAGEYAVLSVSDSGCGMDEATLARVFEPFFTTKVLGRGTGLGLSTVHGIVSQSRGHISVRSRPGEGSTFEILLPRAESVPHVVARPAVVGPERGHETILFVEDEPAVLRLGERMLRRLGYLVVAAAGPSEALRLAREHAGDIDLLITDVIMPEMNGRELARRMQSLYPSLRLLFMSGYTADVVAHEGILDEGVAFLQKPFTMADLGARVRETLDRS